MKIIGKVNLDDLMRRHHEKLGEAEYRAMRQAEEASKKERQIYFQKRAQGPFKSKIVHMINRTVRRELNQIKKTLPSYEG